MIVKKAKLTDLPGIQSLARSYNMLPPDENHIDKGDIAIVAVDGKDVVGFLWVGLMANRKVGYIDHFVVARTHVGKGVGSKLANKALKVLDAKKVKKVFGIIAQDKYHDASAINGLKMAMSAGSHPYTYVYTDIIHSKKELR